MLSQNAVYPHTKGTMRLQKLALLWMLQENGKIINRAKRKNTKTIKTKINKGKDKELKKSHIQKLGSPGAHG